MLGISDKSASGLERNYVAFKVSISYERVVALPLVFARVGINGEVRGRWVLFLPILPVAKFPIILL